MDERTEEQKLTHTVGYMVEDKGPFGGDRPIWAFKKGDDSRCYMYLFNRCNREEHMKLRGVVGIPSNPDPDQWIYVFGSQS